VLVLLPLALLALGLVGYALVHLVRAVRAPYLPKWLRALLIVLVMPWGALTYLLLAHSTQTAAGTPTPAGGATDQPDRAVPRVHFCRWPGNCQRQPRPGRSCRTRRGAGAAVSRLCPARS
jgi:hypothetical protein